MRAAKAYQSVNHSTSVSGARPAELTVLIYEKLLDLLVEARVVAERRDNERCAQVTSRAIEIIELGLTPSLDFEQGGDIASNLRVLYRIWIGEIIKFNITKDVEKLKVMSKQIQEIHDGFKLIIHNNSIDRLPK